METNSAVHGDGEYIKELLERYGKMLFRICYCILLRRDDAEDAMQETYLKYLQKAPDFDSPEHEKAWLIKVATNTSKNMLKLRLRHAAADIEEFPDIFVDDSDSEVFEAIMGLPTKYKIAMDLYYIEGYKVKEVSEITGASPDAVRKRLQKGRELLKDEFERCDYFGS